MKHAAAAMMMAMTMTTLMFWVTGCGTTVVTGDANMGRGATGHANGDDITGHCELVLPTGQVSSCTDVTLFLRAPDDGEERRAEMNGETFAFRDLHRRSYVLSAASSLYELQTNVKNEVTPGQTLKIRIRAKAR